jgi:ankyrin repeat protein
MNEICDLSYFNPIGLKIANYVTDIKILLKIAIRVQNYKVCKTLLDNIKELKYPLIFSDAVQQNNDKIIKLLLNYIYDDNILDERNEFNNTPLNIAIWNENLELCKFLVYNNVNIQGYNDIEDKYGNTNTNSTPLYCAVKSNNYKVVKFLLKEGADPNLWSNTGFDSSGYLPLHAAIKNNNYKIIKLLLLYDANPLYNIITIYNNPLYDIYCEPIHHNSPLYLVIKKEKIKFLKLFKHYYDVISNEELIKLKNEFKNNPNNKYNYSSFKYKMLNKYY